VPQIRLEDDTPTRNIAIVCRSGDAENLRVMAIRDAFASGYGVTRDE